MGHDLLKGNSRHLAPQGQATRAQIAVIFQRTDRVLVPPQSGSDSPKLTRLKALVAKRLPPECRWDERALSAGWYGPMTLRMNGSLENIAEGCVYLLTELDGITYDVCVVSDRARNWCVRVLLRIKPRKAEHPLPARQGSSVFR